MGSCFSTKKESSAAAAPPVSTVQPVDPDKSQKTEQVIPREETAKKEEEEEGLTKKEIFVIKHRNSHEKRSLPQQNEGVQKEEEIGNNINNLVRTSSCTKEEVDAILIQCGRLSRSNSSGKAASSSARKYAGSKRSYDFDQMETGDGVVEKKNCEDEDQTLQQRQRHRHRHPSSPGRRRTPSRERDHQHQQQQRSCSRERGGGINGGGRRVSRSPGRRTENNTSNNTSSTTRPGKMVSVPATVNAVEKTNNGVDVAEPIKRISVKRNITSPRSQSPARTGNPNVKMSNETQQHPSLSRTSSRKAEHSPYRRNPLAEIDTNSNRVQARGKDVQGEAPLLKDSSANILSQKPNVETAAQGTNYKASSRDKEEAKAQVAITNNVNLPQALTRSRSSRRSRDLDLNPETLLNPTPSYTALLLEDIQNFHQNNTTPSFSLPPCVTKACSILEAVADLNSTTSSNLSCAFSENAHNISLVGKKMTEGKDPFVESEVVVSDDLTEPSFHKYVTVRRGGTLGAADLDEQESSGSNSYVGGVQHNRNLSSSSWEPNSVDSTDRSTSMEDGQRHLASETRKGLGGKRRDTDFQKGGNWRSRAGVVPSKSLHTVPIVSASK
ncbi:uncharacterized protein At1g65710 isoform X2 [Mangifera indica]|uniref:uncharacterized protein At1g65710 isoform X2 n=1 Tax=Mangifera indica TaxID=29780 RepID=UPI001CFA0C42|nr:uncharacterized protein At1g65710 isoform X2 [Mangifera indica]